MRDHGPGSPGRRLRGRLLIVAGSDSGGGAGLQADLKTATALGTYAMTAVTAVTAQDTQGIHGTTSIPPHLVALQMRTALHDLGADVIKSGMLGTAEIAEAVLQTLTEHGAGIPLVVDPVMVTSAGETVLEPGADTVLRRLLNQAYLVTPNVPEAARLTDSSILNCDQMIAAGRKLIAMGARAALVTGGHISGPRVTDVLVTDHDVHRYTTERIETRHTHGTGCTLASAISAGLAQGQTLVHATARAHSYVQRAIRTAPGLGRGAGPLNHVA